MHATGDSSGVAWAEPFEMKWNVLRTVNVHSQRDRALITGGGFFYSEHRATGAIGTLPQQPHNRGSRKRRGIRWEAIRVKEPLKWSLLSRNTCDDCRALHGLADCLGGARHWRPRAGEPRQRPWRLTVHLCRSTGIWSVFGSLLFFTPTCSNSKGHCILVERNSLAQNRDSYWLGFLRQWAARLKAEWKSEGANYTAFISLHQGLMVVNCKVR